MEHVVNSPSKLPTRRRYEDAFSGDQEEGDGDNDLVGHIVPAPTKEFNEGSNNKESVESPKKFPCQAPNCTQTFATAKQYQVHYASKHMHSCSICKKSLPSSHLLEMHVLEIHDTLFSMMAEKKPMFQCFVESCPEKFQTRDVRKDHCLEIHKFSKNFQYWECKPPRLGGGKGKSSSKSNTKGKNKGEEQGEMEMDMEADADTEGKKTNNNVPKHIAFGRNPHKVFGKNAYALATTTSNRRNKPKDKNKDNDESIDMKDVGDALASTSST